MARSIAAVDFEDGARLYGVWEGSVEMLLKPLFQSEVEASDWSDAQRVGASWAVRLPKVREAAMRLEGFGAEERVTVTSDIHYAPRTEFSSRALRAGAWLSGPQGLEALDWERRNELEQESA